MLGVAAIIRSTTGEPEITTKELIIHTTSVSPLWACTVVNNGEPLSWSVSGGVTIAEQEYVGNNVPILDLSSNTGTAIISIKSSSSFVGLIEFYVNGTHAADNVTYIDFLKATDLLLFSCKLHANLTSIDISTLVNLQSITFRSNPLMTSLDVSNNPDIIDAWVYSNALTDYNILDTPLVTLLWLYYNNIGSTELDLIVNRLDEAGQEDGELRITGNPGSLTSNAYYGYQNLKDKGWTIDVALPEEPAKIPETKGKPVLSDFTIENSAPTLVNFTASSSLISLSTTGFTILGKSILGNNATINPDLRSGYFTVTTPFTYWDTATIRLESGDGSVHDFTMQFIENNIDEPVSTIIKYAAPTTQGNGDGDTEANAWSYVTAGTSAQPGTTVWMKAGSSSSTMTVSNNGQSNAPIKFIGYTTDINDPAPTLTRSVGMDFDSDVMPLITGTGGFGFSIPAKSYIILRNVQAKDNATAQISIEDAVNTITDNCYVDGGTNGIYSGYRSTDSGCRILNSYVANSSSSGIRMYNNNNYIFNTWVVSSKIVNMDYYISFYGSPYETDSTKGINNIVRDCYVERFNTDSHGGHGISFKAGSAVSVEDQWKLEYNLVENCTIKNVNQSIEPRHRGTKYSVFRNINVEAQGNQNAISMHDGPSYNTFENIYAKSMSTFVRFYETGEDNGNQANSHHNKFINCITDNVYNISYVGQYAPAVAATLVQNNEWLNCTFTNATNLLGSTHNWDNTNKMTNCIFDTVTNLGTGTNGITYLNNLFWGSWTNSIGTGSSNVNPNLDANYQPQAIFDSNLWRERIDGVFYDKSGTERQSLTTVGSIISSDEVSLSIPIIINFRVENATPTLIHFDSTGDISELTIQGFIVSGNNINSVNTADNYFTVDTPFTYWDNSTIRLESGDGTVYDFTLTYITNNINEPTTANVKYVAVGGSGTGDSEGSPMSLTDAFDDSTANTTYWIKAGDYGNIPYDETGKNGGESTPVKFIGYTNTIEDIVAPRKEWFTDYSQKLTVIDSSIYPVLSSPVIADNGINPRNSHYLIFKNFQIDGFQNGVRFSSSGGNYCSNIVTDNITVVDAYFSSNDGTGIVCSFSNSTTVASENIRIKDCLVIDASVAGITLDGIQCMIKDSKVWAGRDADPTDYHINNERVGIDNIIIGNEVRRELSVPTWTHGIGAKCPWNNNTGSAITRLLIAENSVYEMTGEVYWLAYEHTSNCVVKDNYSYNSTQRSLFEGGISFRDGAYNNIAERNYIEGKIGCGITIYRGGEEDNQTTTIMNLNNTYRNNIFKGTSTAMYFENDNDNSRTLSVEGLNVINNTFDGQTSGIFNWADGHLGITWTSFNFKNNIVSNPVGTGSNFYVALTPTITKEYNDYFNIGYSDLDTSGTGNIEVDPEYVNTADYVPQAIIEAPRLVDLDYNNEERTTPNSAIGAQRGASETIT